MSAAPPPIRVVIDRLVLHGVAPADASAVQRALGEGLEAALARARPADLAAPEPLRIDLPTAADPRSLGLSAGRALARSLAPGRGK